MDLLMRIMLSTILWCTAMAAVAHASYISMDTQFSMKTTDGTVFVEVATRNKGDEPAYQVHFEILAHDHILTGARAVQLNMGDLYSDTFPLEEIFPLPGRYPLFVRGLGSKIR
jgi:hypothetical protein